VKGQLDDKVAIVTGGGTGIGEAICRKFAREGAKVVVNGLPGDPIGDVVTAILDDGGVAIPFAGDMSDDGQARACVDAAIEAYGCLDVLINNAGVLLVGSETDKMPLEKFDEHIRCNIRTAFLMTKHALPHLRKDTGKHYLRGLGRGHQRRTWRDRVWWNQGIPARIHGWCRCRAGAVRRACQLRLPRSDRHGLDAQRNRSGRRDTREILDHGHPIRASWNARGGGQCVCLSGLGRSELRDGRAVDG
jgi:NAD(P)-dependent dehydrogenase (short-subunit alcohol dehydrogenase family)